MRGFICIDAPPKSSGSKDEWAIANYSAWGKNIIQPMMYHRLQFIPLWAQNMIERKLDPEEQAWIIQESLRTPTFAALQLALDAIYADYRPEVKLLSDHNIPTLNVVSQSRATNAIRWLQTNAPNACVKVMGKHLMFWEHPDEFNEVVDNFLNGIIK